MTAILVHKPATFANLTVFPLQFAPKRQRSPHPQEFPPGEFLVLEEALSDGRACLYETGVVGELEIENLAELDLFLQAGDMVKGGRQDRTLGADLIVPAHSGRMRIPAFCIEQGRWAQRHNESVAVFSASTEAVASKALRVALRKGKSQAAVWHEVAQLQSKLQESVDATVNAAESPTSLQLSMEAASVRRQIDDYLVSLAQASEVHPEVSGYAFAINGQLNGAELYATPALFQKLWPKLLRAAATEALAESGAAGDAALCDRAAVSLWLGRTRSRKARKRCDQVTGRVSLITREMPEQISFETLDAARAHQCVHQSILSQ
jgi:hypothetical protein